MEVYGKILLVAMPAFLVLVLFEKWYGWFRGRDTYGHLDMISSLSSGITNVVKDVLGLSISILSYRWLVDRVAVYQVEDTFLTYFVAFMALDFSGYWTHRLAHEVNFFWNKHAIHHSSEEFNLACALRQSISSFVNLFTILLLPAALLGVPPQVIGVVAPLHLFAQFWYHTRHIGKSCQMCRLFMVLRVRCVHGTRSGSISCICGCLSGMPGEQAAGATS